MNGRVFLPRMGDGRMNLVFATRVERMKRMGKRMSFYTGKKGLKIFTSSVDRRIGFILGKIFLERRRTI